MSFIKIGMHFLLGERQRTALKTYHMELDVVIVLPTCFDIYQMTLSSSMTDGVIQIIPVTCILLESAWPFPNRFQGQTCSKPKSKPNQISKIHQFSWGYPVNVDDNCSQKFLSLCYIDRESWVFWVVLLIQPFWQCLHVPGCIALQQKNSVCQVSKVVICCIRTFPFFNFA